MESEDTSVTRETYESIASDYQQRDASTDVPEAPDVKRALDQFVEKLPRSSRVLDIGCGAGRDARYLVRAGLRVIGIDSSVNMIAGAQELDGGVEYQVMDFEELKFPDVSFDAVWANASLHHIPKDRLRSVLITLNRLLNPEGLLFIKVKHGKGEGLRVNEKFGRNLTRFFSFYLSDELKQMVIDAGFLVDSVTPVTGDEWVDLLARKSES